MKHVKSRNVSPFKDHLMLIIYDNSKFSKHLQNTSMLQVLQFCSSQSRLTKENWVSLPSLTSSKRIKSEGWRVQTTDIEDWGSFEESIKTILFITKYNYFKLAAKHRNVFLHTDIVAYFQVCNNTSHVNTVQYYIPVSTHCAQCNLCNLFHCSSLCPLLYSLTEWHITATQRVPYGCIL